MNVPSLVDLIDEPEIASLAEAYGPADRWRETVVMGEEAFADWWYAIGDDRNRRGEVVLAIRRPDGHVLLHTKAQYPPGTYRLPTGGVKPSEPVLAAALREAYEETGLAVVVERFVGVIEYVLRHAEDGREVPFVSYVLVVRASHAEPVVQDPDEAITDFRFVPPTDLPAIARDLRALPGTWGDWGRFRAPSHERVAAVVEDEIT